MSSPYDNFAKYYDGWFIGSILKAYHKQAVKFISPYIKKDSAVLDVGCGTGAFLKQLVKKKWKLQPANFWHWWKLKNDKASFKKENPKCQLPSC